MNNRRQYLGDGVYARLSQRGEVVLATARDDLDENGDRVESIIFLEPAVWTALVAFVQHSGKENATT